MVLLKPERARAVAARRHPWIYSGAILRADDQARQGELVAVAAPGGEVLGWGFYSEKSLIAVRLLGFGAEPPGEDWLERRLENAFRLRQALAVDSDAFRLVNAEGDALPGLIIDIYNRTAVVRPLIRPVEKLLERILAVLARLVPDCAVYLKRDERASRLEDLILKNGYLAGSGEGREIIREGALRFQVDIERGQKTGFYLDQRDNRLLARRLASGRSVLNLFAYTGAFSLQAAAGGALGVTSVESSRGAAETFRESLALNPQLDRDRLPWIEADVFDFLQMCDPIQLVILDPPPFARRKSELAGALRGYTQLNRLAMLKTEPGGLLMSFSCSGAVSAADFLALLKEASRLAGREAQLLQELHAAPDHPVALSHPEGEYLKGWLLRLL